MVAGDVTLAIVFAGRAALDWTDGQRLAPEGLWAAPLMIRGALLALVAPGQWRRLACGLGILVSLGFGAAVCATDLVGPLKVFTATFFCAAPLLVLTLLALDRTRAGAVLRRMAPWGASAVRIGATVVFLTFLSGGFVEGRPVQDFTEKFHTGWIAGWMVWTATSFLTAAFLAGWACRLGAGRAARSLWLLTLLGTLVETAGFTLMAMNTGGIQVMYFGVALAFVLGHIVTGLCCVLMAGITPAAPPWLRLWSLGVFAAALATAGAAWTGDVALLQMAVTVEAFVLFPWFVAVGQKMAIGNNP